MVCKTEFHNVMEKCHSNHQNSCCCGTGTQFLSKKKNIELLNQRLTDLRERVKDMEDYIAELKDEN